jgi:hypothetical protein
MQEDPTPNVGVPVQSYSAKDEETELPSDVAKIEDGSDSGDTKEALEHLFVTQLGLGTDRHIEQ